MSINIVKNGTWLYDGLVAKSVDIIALDFDWWYEMVKEEEGLEEGELPIPLGEDGYIYYVRFLRAGETEHPTWVDSGGERSLNEAIKIAESKVTGEITWRS